MIVGIKTHSLVSVEYVCIARENWFSLPLAALLFLIKSKCKHTHAPSLQVDPREQSHRDCDSAPPVLSAHASW